MVEFDPNKIIDLDACVFNTLQLFIDNKLPGIDLSRYKRPLVVGSGNAAVTGRILFEGQDAVFADESTYIKELEASKNIDGALLISASGGKHAPIIAQELKKRGLNVTLLTNNPDALAKPHVDEAIVLPKNPEPYTYNTSTYMGMIMAHTKEDPQAILDFIKKEIEGKTPDFSVFDAFYMIVPAEFDNVRELFLTKFDELFGPKINGRVFTPEQTKHAKTVVPSDTEMFISIGYDNQIWGEHRYNVKLPTWMKHAGVMAIGYYIIGKIQKQNEQYFKKNILAYTQKASKLFGQDIKPIVE